MDNLQDSIYILCHLNMGSLKEDAKLFCRFLFWLSVELSPFISAKIPSQMSSAKPSLNSDWKEKMGSLGCEREGATGSGPSPKSLFLTCCSNGTSLFTRRSSRCCSNHFTCGKECNFNSSFCHEKHNRWKATSGFSVSMCSSAHISKCLKEA